MNKLGWHWWPGTHAIPSSSFKHMGQCVRWGVCERGCPAGAKASFDVGGVVTTCGSAVLADALPAAEDAEAVRRLRTAGFIVIGQTNMTEFAYSAVGSNAVYGTPACAWDRARRLIPGGSSSGAAVSVTDGMAAAALGSDSARPGRCGRPVAWPKTCVSSSSRNS